MECSQIRKILFEYPDRDFPDDIRDTVESHLAECRGCAAQLRALQDQISALGSLEKLRAPTGFLERVQERVQKDIPFRRIRQYASAFFHSWQFLKLAGAAAALVLVVATVQSVHHRDKQKEPYSSYSPLIQDGSIETAPPPMASDVSGKEERAAAKMMAPTVIAPPPPAAPLEAHRDAITLLLRIPEPPHARSALTSSSTQLKDKAQPLSAGVESAETGSTGKSAAKLERSADRPRRESTVAEHRLSIQEAMSEVRHLFISLGGKVHEAEADSGGAKVPDELDAELPSENYSALMDRLRSIGDLSGHKADTTMPVPGSTVHLRIKFSSGS